MNDQEKAKCSKTILQVTQGLQADSDARVNIASNSKKPPYQTGKTALWALGRVDNLQKAVEGFNRKTRAYLDQKELECQIKKSYDNGDILYFEYDADGNPVKRDTFSSKTASFAVNTGEQDEYQKDVFAQYSKGSRGWEGVFFNTEEQIFNKMNAYKMGKLTFKDYASANKFIKNLHDELLPGETWKYAEPAQNVVRKKTEYEILESYLRTVFAALLQEHDVPRSLNYGKIKFSQDKDYALFNTGLLTKYATDVIVIGEVYPKNKATNSNITLSNPVILTGGMEQLQENEFDILDGKVDMVSFFKEVSEIVYDANAEVDTSNIDKLHHCIVEGIKRERFPQECEELYNEGNLVALTDQFKQAIQRSERIARRNYKYVVPQYRTTKTGNKIQFLMPIYMSSKYEGAPDFALVLSESIDKKNNKFYKPETVLELAWAYNNARVICKPEDTWLNPARIEDVEDVEDPAAIDE